MVFKNTSDQFVIKNQYDAKDNIKNLFRFTGTIVPRTLRCFDFRFAIVVHYVLFFVRKFATCPRTSTQCGPSQVFYDWNVLMVSDTTPIAAVAIFFLVFYNGNCFSRFISLYQLVNNAGGQLHGTSLYLRDYFESPISRWQVIRYMLASHRIFFYVMRKQLAEWYGFGETSSLHPGNWEKFAEGTLIPLGLLLKEETDWLESYEGNKHKPCLSWSVAALRKIIDQHHEHPKTGYTFDTLGVVQRSRESRSAGGLRTMMPPLPPTAGREEPFDSDGFNWVMDRNMILKNVLNNIQGMLTAITQAEEMWLLPVPFYYYHLLNSTLLVSLLILAYAFLFAGGGGTYVSLVAFPFCAFILVALRETATAMADPFGEDDCDFNLAAFQEGVYNDCRTICLVPRTPFYTRIGVRDWLPQSIKDEMPARAPSRSATPPEGHFKAVTAGLGKEISDMFPPRPSEPLEPVRERISLPSAPVELEDLPHEDSDGALPGAVRADSAIPGTAAPATTTG